MRNVIRNLAFALVSAGCMAPSAAINVVHQLTHAPAGLAWPCAGASVLSVAFAGLAPIAISRALARASWARASIYAALLIVCVGFNLASAVGVSSTSRAEHSGAAAKVENTAKALAAQIEGNARERAALARKADGATVAMLDHEQAGLRNDAKWKATKDCTDATKPESRAFCVAYEAVGARKEAAMKVEALDLEIRPLRDRLDAANASPDATHGQPADAQSANVGAALSAVGVSLDLGQVAIGLNLWFALALELIGAVGPLMLGDLFAIDGPRIDTKSRRIDTLDPVQDGTGEPIDPTDVFGEPASEPKPIRQKARVKKALAVSPREPIRPVLTIVGSEPARDTVEADVIRAYGTMKSMARVASSMGLSKSRVQRIVAKAKALEAAKVEAECN